MDEREYNLELKRTDVVRTVSICEQVSGCVRAAIIGAVFLWAIHLILEGIKPIIGQNADSIHAMAHLVESFKLGTIVQWIATAAVGVAYAVERKGKQRAVREKNKYQAIAEKNDPNRSSSGLTPIGHTPDNE